MLPIALVTNSSITTTAPSRNKLIRSYGFQEQLSINENFLQDSLELVKRITGFRFASIRLVDDENEYVHSLRGVGVITNPLKDSITKWAIGASSVFEIIDTNLDARIKELPAVQRQDNIRSYVSVPLTNKENINIGIIAVSDIISKEKLTEDQKGVLFIIARQVMNTFEEQKKLIKLIKEINNSFKPAECSDLSCLYGELGHLQIEVIEQSKVLMAQKNMLQNSNKELKSFAHVVAHDIKSPLQTITNFAGLVELSLQKGSKEKSKEYLEYIKKASTNLNGFVEDILHVAEVDQDVESTEISLNSILEKVILNLHSLLQDSNAQIKLPKQDVLVRGKSSQLVQLFQNLIANGIKYQDGKELPCIRIRAKAKEGKVKISVKDNGIGIEKKYQKEIFKPFKRAHVETEYDGLGIGLATCQKIIKDHGSKIKVKSKIGKGTKFEFTLQSYGK